MILVATGCSATGADEPTKSAGQQGYVGVEGNLTRIPPEQRKPAPLISGGQLGSDQTVSTDAYAGKVLVVNIWASWCAPCREEAPALQEASEATKQIAQFLGINTRDNDPAPAEAFIRVSKISYPSIYDPSGKTLLPFAGQLPPSAIPSTLVIDQQGRVAVRVLGAVSKITLVDMINAVAAGE